MGRSHSVTNLRNIVLSKRSRLKSAYSLCFKIRAKRRVHSDRWQEGNGEAGWAELARGPALWTHQPRFAIFLDLVLLTSLVLSVCSFSGGSTLMTRTYASPPVPLLFMEPSPSEPVSTLSEISTQVSAVEWLCWNCFWRVQGVLCHLCCFSWFRYQLRLRAWV